ncbi:MAG: hypothetical protein HGGPFJEG_01179 [Ignavibacteria bacterium]|nr:hypothetical protein [Ignavibacteria bacterium]
MQSKLLFFILLCFPIFVLAQVTQQWVQIYGGPNGSTDYPWLILVDNSGNVYVTGYIRSTYYDYATIKYNSSGIQQWVKIYNGPTDGTDEAWSMAVDNSGNVYVTGASEGSGSGRDYLTIKYNSSGIEQWIQRYNGPSNGLDEAWSVAVDDSGNVYVTGGSTGSGTGLDYTTIKYNSSGIEQWNQRYNAAGNGMDEAYSLAIDKFGNVFVAGTSNYDYAIIKYNSSGVHQWVQRYNGPGNSWDNVQSIFVDSSGYVYVTGSSVGSGTSDDYATIKYNSSGIQQWLQRYNGPPTNGRDNATSVKVDNEGNVYVTGYSYGIGTSRDYATLKYNSSGVEQWVQRYNGPGNDLEYAYSIAVDNSGNVYVTGSSIGIGTGPDYATIKYNSSGVEQWVERYHRLGNMDIATSIAIDTSGNLYVTGYNSSDGYVTIKYSQTIGIQYISTQIPEQFSLSQNFPNPFNPITNIKFDIPKKSFVKLVIYDLLGKEVAVLVNEELNAGSYYADWNASEFPSGVYFYRLVVSGANPLQTDDFVETRSMVLVK